MHSISTRRRLVAVLLLPFLMVLAGCGKLHADFEIKDADTVNTVFDIAVDTEFAEGVWNSAESFCSEMQGETPLEEDAPTVEPYEESGQFGCVITGVITSENFDSNFNVTEEDGEFHLVLSGDESMTAGISDPAVAGLDFDFRMTFTFPGEIIEANGGEIDGSSVTYSSIDALATGIDIRADSRRLPLGHRHRGRAGARVPLPAPPRGDRLLRDPRPQEQGRRLHPVGHARRLRFRGHDRYRRSGSCAGPAGPAVGPGLASLGGAAG